MVHFSLIIQTELSGDWHLHGTTTFRTSRLSLGGHHVRGRGRLCAQKQGRRMGGKKWCARTPTGTNYGSATDANVFLMFAWPPPNGRNWDKCWSLIFTAVARYIFLQSCRPAINVIIMKFITISTQVMRFFLAFIMRVGGDIRDTECAGKVDKHFT